MFKNTSKSYGLISIIFHWSTAFLMIGLFILGIYMVDFDYYHPWYHLGPWWHIGLGFIVFVITIFRLSWFQFNPKPLANPNHKPWERKLSTFIRHALYYLIILLTITGFLSASYKGEAVNIFDIISIPSLFTTDDEFWVMLIDQSHFIIALVWCALVILHILGALKHQFIDRDKILNRIIIPGESYEKN